MTSPALKTVSYLLSLSALSWFVFWMILYRLELDTATYTYLVPRALPIISILVVAVMWRRSRVWVGASGEVYGGHAKRAFAISVLGNCVTLLACYSAFNGSPQEVFSDEITEFMAILVSSVVSLISQTAAVIEFQNMKSRWRQNVF